MSTPTSPPLQLAPHVALSPDASRALRATIAFMVPLVLAVTGWLPVNASFATLTAQNLAMVDVRGDYRFRLGLLLAMAAVFIGAAALGSMVADNLPAAIVATILISVCGSTWRHLSSDYGPSLAISSAFVFLFALASPPGLPAVGDHSLATFVGALWGIAVQVAAWPFRPQHPLRRAVADAWVAVAELFDVMGEPSASTLRHEHLVEKETALWAALDDATEALATPHQTSVRADLEAMNFAAARLAMRVAALNTALEPLEADPLRPWLRPTIAPLLANLSNIARSIAVTIVSHQPGHLVTCEVRLRRASALLRAVRARLGHQPGSSPAAQLDEILGQIEVHLPAIHEALRATVRRANERGAFSLELLDLRAVALRPLASALNLRWNIDPALIRFTFRSAILTTGGVVAYKLLGLPHGYWLPFTMIVVLQPDYGSTRRRAAQRVLGTLVGSIAASLILWLRLPLPVLMLACAATIFTFGYWLKRNYGIAVVFITLFVVLLTEANGPVSIELAIERLGSTLAGGLVALLAAQLFWPVWERERLPPIVAEALRANRDYLRLLVERVAAGRTFDAEAREAKRKVERANAAVFSSLNRLSGDPKNQREGLEHAATIANGNQRIVRALNVLALHLTAENRWHDPSLLRFAKLADRAFELVATAIEREVPAPAELDSILEALESEPLAAPTEIVSPHRWAFIQLTQVTTELCALLVAVQESAPARA
jgi:uncharacterized membrane protein YccC